MTIGIQLLYPQLFVLQFIFWVPKRIKNAFVYSSKHIFIYLDGVRPQADFIHETARLVNSNDPRTV